MGREAFDWVVSVDARYSEEFILLPHYIDEIQAELVGRGAIFKITKEPGVKISMLADGETPELAGEGVKAIVQEKFNKMGMNWMNVEVVEVKSYKELGEAKEVTNTETGRPFPLAKVIQLTRKDS